MTGPTSIGETCGHSHDPVPALNARLVSTRTGEQYPLTRIEEFSPDGDSLEVEWEGTKLARIRDGSTPSIRYREFFPFLPDLSESSLGEGMTPVLRGGSATREWTGLAGLWFKNETVNPTWSFKDRGSLTCIAFARSLGEKITATISTGNMGQSVAAYAARAGMYTLVFAPDFAPDEKIVAMAAHGASVLRVSGCDYATMKKEALSLAGELDLRIVSGNGPVRVEGYKMEAFELFEQTQGQLPDWIAIPTSACGHIRGIFKGFKELQAAGYIQALPGMIIVQPAVNSPIVSSILSGSDKVLPFSGFTTLAEALTSGNPPGGEELLRLARTHGWLAAVAREDEILEAQSVLGREGLFVEPGTATLLPALRSLVSQGKIDKNANVLAILTGSGMKDMKAAALGSIPGPGCDIHEIHQRTSEFLGFARARIT